MQLSKWVRENILIGTIILIAVLVGARSLVVWSAHKTELARQTTKTADEIASEQLVAEIGKLIVLPSDEIPTIATVSDPETLRSQPFFARAQKGDKVLIYTKMQKAILYDPRIGKIVEVAPINLSGSALGSTGQ